MTPSNFFLKISSPERQQKGSKSLNTIKGLNAVIKKAGNLPAFYLDGVF